MKECHAVSKPRRKRTQNYATRGRFPPTLVIFRLGAVEWPTSFIQFPGEFVCCVVCL